MEERFSLWLEHLESRHARALSFVELRKGVVALSRVYVEARDRLERGAAFDGNGKKAAFACFYTPLHYLAVRNVIENLCLHEPAPRRILDLGCGLAAAGGAWSLAAGGKPFVQGIDQNGWAVREARRSLSALGVRGAVRRESIGQCRVSAAFDAVVAAYALNELDCTSRRMLLDRLLRVGACVLVIEPIARRLSPWWDEWTEAFVRAGGQSHAWRFRCDLPERLKQLDVASGLNHSELKVRSLVIHKKVVNGR